jgi:hypothetical protein
VKLFISTALLLLTTSVLSPRGFASCPDGPHTLYSQRAVSFDNDLVKLQSPDRKKILIVKRVWDDKSPEGVYFSFSVETAGRSLTTRLEEYTNGEALWSPDSSAFAVTATNNCGARAFVFDVEQGGLKAVDVDSVVQKAFGMPVKCEIPVQANTGVVDWAGSSANILIAAEVTPCSFCECSGMYEVYDVDLRQGQIARTYTQMAAKKKLWKLLGCELRDADNGCADRLQRK